jgi:hypothetical protein
MGESGSLESRLEWIAALDKLELLDANVVFGGHSDPESSFGPEAIGETKAYLEDFNWIADESGTAEEIYARMMELCSERLIPVSR